MIDRKAQIEEATKCLLRQESEKVPPDSYRSESGGILNPSEYINSEGVGQRPFGDRFDSCLKTSSPENKYFVATTHIFEHDNRKIILSKMRIEHAIKSYGADHCAVAYSFRKDSMAILKMVTDIDPNIPVVQCDTKCESKHTYDFAKKIIKEWNLNIHIARTPKGVNFWTIAKEYGIPNIRGDGTKRLPMCCQLLKDEPAEKMYRKMKTRCIMTGVTAEESHQRFMLMQRNANKAQAQGILYDDAKGYECSAKYYGKTNNRLR